MVSLVIDCPGWEALCCVSGNDVRDGFTDAHDEPVIIMFWGIVIWVNAVNCFVAAMNRGASSGAWFRYR